MAQNSRELVRCLFEGQPAERPPFFPWVCSLAATLEQVPVKTMLSDPGILSRALSNTHKLFGYDLIINHFDLTLEAEALGCEIERWDDTWPFIIIGHPLEHGADFYDLDTEGIEKKGRIPVILETTKRLILTKAKEVPIAAMITGPLTLAKHLKGDEFARQLELEDDDATNLVEDAGSICLKLCREYCELGVDIIVIAEDMRDLVIQDLSSVLASPFKSLFNVSRFYNVNSVLISRTRDDNQASSISKLGADALSVSGNIVMNHLQEKAGMEDCRYSVTIPDSALIGTDPENINPIKNAIKSGESGYFLASEWELPRDTSVNSMHRIMKIIRGESND